MAAIHERQLGAHAAILTLDNPPANALGRAMRTQLLEKLDALEANTAIRAVVLTGTGKAFCSGDDLKEQQAASAKSGADRNAHLSAFAHVLARLEAFRAPVIAAINGWCMGGGLELALCCDIRIASSEASFTCSGVNVGLMASAWRLPRLIGVARAKHMLMTGLAHDATTAERFGLVTALHAPDALEREAIALAERIASRAPLSVEATKRMAGMALHMAADEAAAMQAAQIAGLSQTDDHKNALAAFAEKRTPQFKRR